MKKYEVDGTPKTPKVHFDTETGNMSLTGRSVHENSDRFYSPIFEFLSAYAEKPASKTTVHIELEYFNTSSAKYILDIMKKLDDINSAGNPVEVMWVFEKGDLDMEEAGQDYNDLVDLAIQVVEKQA